MSLYPTWRPVLRSSLLSYMKGIALLLVFPLLLMGDSAGAETLSHGRFKRVEIYLPRGQVKHFAFLLSGDGGWSSGLASIAKRLANEGTLVAGIDTPQLYTNLEE